MLKRLTIYDFAIVEHLQIEFESGFQVLTGETGAGKSILVGALGLLCGERGHSDFVRGGAEKAVLEAEFELEKGREKEQQLRTLNVDPLGTILIIRREITAKGISRAFINDTPVNITTLAQVTADLIDMHGQHQHQRLIHPENHIFYLDAFAGLDEQLKIYQASYASYQKTKAELNRMVQKRRDAFDKHDLYSFQLAELEKAQIEDGELESLQSERRILENTEVLFQASDEINKLLYGDEGGAAGKLSKALKRLETVADIDPKFSELLESLEQTKITVEEIGRHCEQYSGSLEFDAERLETIRTRESHLEWLMKKYQVETCNELIRKRDEFKSLLHNIESFDDKIENLQKTLNESQQEVTKHALSLSEQRKKAARDFEKRLSGLLSDVGLKNARFAVQFGFLESGDGLVQINDQKYALSENGIDQVEFLVGLNVGEPVRALQKIASGGEISRIMLCIKALLAELDDIGTLIFDEIDSGISGRFAEIVGKKMKQIAHRHQLLVITHLPQIAAQGDAHYSVRKSETEGRTQVNVQKLDVEERITDIARLLGGEQLTPQAIANARQLISVSPEKT